MKKNWKIALPVVVVLLTLSFILGYEIGVRSRFGHLKTLAGGKDSLIGIWQSNPFMASGWSDRYHFYANGKFHYYPNQMICSENEDEILGNWSTDERTLTLTITSRVSIEKKCDNKGFGTEIHRYVFELYQSETETLRYVNLGILSDDPYPSILLDGQQYWKFSDDPTRYGDEKFPSD